VARIVLTGGLQQLAGGVSELEVDAPNVRALIAALEERFPGFQQRIDESMSIAIDGDIIQEPLLEPIEPNSEIHFLPQIQGG
jgi:molybdopterin converting factor small subunit